MRMMATPVSASPAMTARWIGAAPLQRGRSEAWMLKQPKRGEVKHAVHALHRSVKDVGLADVAADLEELNAWIA
jgi:hypothetical protein